MEPPRDRDDVIRTTSDDERFGAIEVVVDPGRSAIVRGTGIPTATIERIGDGTAAASPPIGTREAAELVATLGGRTLRVQPGAGRISRRSFRVVASLGDETWLLTPASSEASRLVRGARYDGRNELAMLTRDAEGGIVCAWSEEVSVGPVRIDALEPTPEEAAIGHLLAAAFQTGAGFAFMHVLEQLELLLPG